VPCPPVFGWLQRIGSLAEREMLRTFNCGIGMMVVVDASHAAPVAVALSESGENVVELGIIAARKGNEERVKPLGRLVLV
jgi:phosphoribosylformylglycinamidine cyclo-ligase